MEAETDCFAPERVRDLENQLERVRSERVEEIAKLSSEKKALQDRLHDAELQILQLKLNREELKKVVNEKDALEDENRRLRQTVGQTEGEQRKKKRIIGYEQLRGYAETYRDDIKSLYNKLMEEEARHAPLYGDGLDALSMEELERISHIHEEGLRQIHARAALLAVLS